MCCWTWSGFPTLQKYRPGPATLSASRAVTGGEAFRAIAMVYDIITGHIWPMLMSILLCI